MRPKYSECSSSKLRRRSFRGKQLQGVNFQGADLRGCDFSGADLSGADFSQARIGVAPEALVWGGFVFLITAAFSFHMLSQLIFSVMGMVGSDPIYGLSIALMAILSVVGGGMALISWGIFNRQLLFVTAAFEGGLIGFFVGGLFSDLELTLAIVGSVGGVILMLLGTHFLYAQGMGIAIATFGVTMANGMFFLAGIHCLQTLMGGQLFPAVGWFLVALLYWGCVIRSIGVLYLEVKRMGQTSFQDANLTHVRWK